LTVRIFRLGSARHSVWDGSGARDHGGRWNPPGFAAIYGASSLALAMLERLVQRRGLGDTLVVEAEAPDRVSVEDAMAAIPSGWDEPDYQVSQEFGRSWLSERRSALLLVPSVVVPREANIVVNPDHPDARFIRVGTPRPLDWDRRLFGITAPKR
jgi:RES domain-containing protein